MRSLLLASVLLVACGSSNDSSTAAPGAPASQVTLDDACAASCASQKKCSSTVDETACITKCKNQYASVATKLRSDYLVGIADCSRTASCDKLNDCDDTSAASISPTSTAQAYCDELIKKRTECRVGNTDKSVCLNENKIWADTTLDQARACLTKSCVEYGLCLLGVVGN